MGRSIADDVLENFQNGIPNVDEWKVMQVSSDGPNVSQKELDPLMDLGTCGLYVVHGSLNAGAKASDWELQKLLEAM